MANARKKKMTTLAPGSSKKGIFMALIYAGQHRAAAESIVSARPMSVHDPRDDPEYVWHMSAAESYAMFANAFRNCPEDSARYASLFDRLHKFSAYVASKVFTSTFEGDESFF